MRNFFITIVVIAMFSCNTGKDQKAEPEDSANTEIISETDSLLNTQSAIAEFRITTDTEISKDQLTPIEEWREENVIQSNFSVSPQFMHDYRSVIRYSPDSSKILDFGSYGSVVTQNEKGQTVLEGGDPDTEVSLIDLKTKKRTRLFFSGPSGIIKSGSWLNNSTVLFGGYFNEDNSAKPDTLFWLVNVDSMRFSKYRYHK